MNNNINLFAMAIAIGWALVYGAGVAIMIGMFAFIFRLQFRLMQYLNITAWSAVVVVLVAYLQLLTSAS